MFVVLLIIKYNIMKKISLLLVGVAFISCKNTDKSDADFANEVSIDSLKTEYAKQRVIDSMNTIMVTQQAQQKEVIVVNQTAATQATPAKKKMSGALKGALIGAGVGAATGAVISEKKGEGAIIGGLAGAGVGAGTGAIIDGSKKKE